MALSEHERKVLEQMERALLEEDPSFAKNLGKNDPVGVSRARLVRAGLGFALGFVILVTGLVLGVALNWTVGSIAAVVGFLSMLAAAVYGLTQPKRISKPVVNSATKNRSSGNFMSRLEDRWDNRNGL